MLPTEDWRVAMHDRDQRHTHLRGLVRGIVIVLGIISLGLIGVGVAVADSWGYITGGLGFVGAALLWWEV